MVSAEAQMHGPQVGSAEDGAIARVICASVGRYSRLLPRSGRFSAPERVQRADGSARRAGPTGTGRIDCRALAPGVTSACGVVGGSAIDRIDDGTCFRPHRWRGLHRSPRNTAPANRRADTRRTAGGKRSNTFSIGMRELKPGGKLGVGLTDHFAPFPDT